MLNLAGSAVEEVWSSGGSNTSDKGVVASGAVLLIKVGAGTGKKEEKPMSSISGVGHFLPVQRELTAGTRVPPAVVEQGSAEVATDRVEISGGARLATTGRPDVSGYLAKLKSNDYRPEKVASVKGAIEDGSYDENSKLDIALSRLLGDLNA
jgi:anti-sigma28 factor (negative regulator of flagellin synthesis)